jgi:redox-sensitive bicupin YhaK (pirin superfamily)
MTHQGPSPHDIETIVVPRMRDLGGFEVGRVLPAAERQMVGPFVFFDQMGPAAFGAGQGIDVRPHPHIGLATVTYLFEGEILHRDSLGTVQTIRPGELNWMTAGRGIVHSERTGPEARAAGQRMFGIQSWVALAQRDEETAPDFAHFAVGELPMVEDKGVRVRLIAGEAFGAAAPVAVSTPLFYADVQLDAGARVPIDAPHEERALYVVAGAISIDGVTHEAGRMLVLRPGAAITLAAAGPARVMALGGATLDGPRHLWWNFVSSRPERIEAAKADWRAGRFPKVPDETEFIPLPA